MTGIKEFVSDYCKADTSGGRKSIPTSKKCEQPNIGEHQMLQIEYNVEQVMLNSTRNEEQVIVEDQQVDTIANCNRGSR